MAQTDTERAADLAAGMMIALVGEMVQAGGMSIGAAAGVARQSQRLCEAAAAPDAAAQWAAFSLWLADRQALPPA